MPQINMFRATNIKTGYFQPSNSNGLEIIIEASDCLGNADNLYIQTYDLPDHVVKALRDTLGEHGPSKDLDEAAIRADERAKVIAEISNPAAFAA